MAEKIQQGLFGMPPAEEEAPAPAAPGPAPPSRPKSVQPDLRGNPVPDEPAGAGTAISDESDAGSGSGGGESEDGAEPRPEGGTRQSRCWEKGRWPQALERSKKATR